MRYINISVSMAARALQFKFVEGTKIGCWQIFYMAVREGFEPSIRFHVYTLSRRAPSATRTPHRLLF